MLNFTTLIVDEYEMSVLRNDKMRSGFGTKMLTFK